VIVPIGQRSEPLFRDRGVGMGMRVVGRLKPGVTPRQAQSELVAARAMKGLLFGVGSADPATFAAVALMLLLVTVTASYIPARRAARVDPIIALRRE
jgi:hypothetical protein